MSTSREQGNSFHIDARGMQEASGANVELVDGRATITIDGAQRIGLTLIQTDELGYWLREKTLRRRIAEGRRS